MLVNAVTKTLTQDELKKIAADKVPLMTHLWIKRVSLLDIHLYMLFGEFHMIRDSNFFSLSL